MLAIGSLALYLLQEDCVSGKAVHPDEFVNERGLAAPSQDHQDLNILPSRKRRVLVGFEHPSVSKPHLLDHHAELLRTS